MVLMQTNRHEPGLTTGNGNPACHSICHPVCHPEFISGSQTLPGQEIPKQVRDDSSKDSSNDSRKESSKDRADGDDRNNDREVPFSGETVIIAIFSEVAAWRGSAGIDDMVINQVNELIRHAGTSIVISFGSPYILRYFRDADVLLAAYEANVHIQGAVIKCLKGETYFKGWLPVRL